MNDPKDSANSPGFPSPRLLVKDGPDAQVDLSPLSRYWEKQYGFVPLAYLRNTPEGLVGSWQGAPVRIPPSSNCFRRIEKTLKAYQGPGPEMKLWSVVSPVFLGGEWVGCVALGRGGKNKEAFSYFHETCLPLLAWAVGTALENHHLMKMLERADRHSSLGFLSAGVFHEIRNPLTALSTLVQLLPLKKNDAAFMDSFQALMLKELERLDVLTDQSLKFARSEGMEGEGVGLDETLERIRQLIRPSLGRKKTLFKLKIEPGLRLKVDPSQFESLVVNLLKNALSAVGEKGLVQVCVKRVYRGNKKGKPWVCLTVKDNGKGIDPKKIKRIFDPYFTTRLGGTGLGLAICRRVMENHHGILNVKSKPGKGTAFSAYFPSQYTSKNQIISDFRPKTIH
jgi:nitrogen-specific signal transduction histidine kinase